MRAAAPMSGRPWWRRALAFATVVLVGAAALAASPAAAEDAPAAAGTFTEVEVAVLYDGQTFGPLDDGPSNGIVAVNDVVGFVWKVTATDLSGGVLEQTLPDGWAWEPESLVPANSSTDLFQVTGTISDDGRTLTVLVETLTNGNPARFELGALRAVPSSAVPNQSGYAAELIAHDAAGRLTATAPPITVVSEPRAELWKSYVATAATSSAHDFGDGVGPVASRYIDYRLSIREPQGRFAIGASVATLQQPVVVADTFTVTGAKAEFQAAATATSVAGASAVIEQNGRSFTVALDGFGAVASLWVDVRLWVRYSDLPASGGAVTVTNAIAPAENWVTTEGAPIVVDTTNTKIARTISRPAQISPGSASKAMFLFTDQAASGAISGDPTQSTSKFAPLTGGSAVDREVAPGSLVAARLRVRAGSVDSLSTGLTSLVAYDFWNPGQQQIVDGATIFVGQNLAMKSIASSLYSVQYSAGSNTADPEGNAWFDSIEDAGGVAAVSGIRIAYLGASWKKGADPLYAWFTVGVPFRLVGPVGTEAADSAVYRYDEKPDGLSARAAITVGSHRLSTRIAASASSIMSGGAVDYAVTPVATPPPGAEYSAMMQGLGLDVVLPPGLHSVQVDDPPAGWTVTAQGDAENGMTLHYAYAAEWATTTPLPTFTYQVVAGVLAPTSQAFVTTAVVFATGNAQAEDTRTAVNSVSVQQVAAVSEQKLVIGDSTVQPGDTARWEARWYNTTSSSAGRSHFVDVLPFDGDARGSRFTGSLVVTGAALVGGDPGSMQLQYTTARSSEVVAAGDSAAAVDWVDTDGADLATIAGVTALRVVVDDFGATVSGYIALQVSARVDGAKHGDRFSNTVDTWLGIGGHLGESNRATVDVVAGAIDGTVWVEAADARLLSDHQVVPDATVRLIDGDGATVATTQTDGDGHYRFDGLRGGSFRTAVDPTTLGSAAHEHVVNVFDLDGDLNHDSGSVAIDVGASVGEVDFRYRFDPVAIALTKSGRIGDDPALGDLVEWAFTLTNVGATPVTGVSLQDHLEGARDLVVAWGEHAPGELPAGASVTATASSPLTAADLVAGTVTNTATLDAVGPGGIHATADAEATVEWRVSPPVVVPGGGGGAEGAPVVPSPRKDTPVPPGGGLATTGGAAPGGGALAGLGALILVGTALIVWSRRRAKRDGTRSQGR